MARNIKAKKAKQFSRNTLSFKEHKELAREAVATAMLLQIVAMVDVLKCTEEQMCEVMETTSLYSQHFDNHLIQLRDAAESLKKSTGIDLTIRNANRKPLHFEAFKNDEEKGV